MERATFYADLAGEEVRGTVMAASGNSGNAASRVESSSGPRAPTPMAAIPTSTSCSCNKRRARRRRSGRQCSQDPAAHDRPGDVRANHGPAGAERHRPSRDEGHDHRRLDEPVPVVRGHGGQAGSPSTARPPWGGDPCTANTFRNSCHTARTPTRPVKSPSPTLRAPSPAKWRDHAQLCQCRAPTLIKKGNGPDFSARNQRRVAFHCPYSKLAPEGLSTS